MDTSDKKSSDSNLSDLARIDLISDSPYDLFKEWHAEARKFSTGLPNALCLATLSKDLKVTTRHVMLRRLDEDGFVIVSDIRSQKAQHLRDVPSASMCFLWAYVNDKKNLISRQVRIEGVVKELPKEDYQHIYESEPLFCKIRSYISNQEQINWDEQKQKHDLVLKQVQSGELSLPMPSYLVARETKSCLEAEAIINEMIGGSLKKLNRKVSSTRPTSENVETLLKI